MGNRKGKALLRIGKFTERQKKAEKKFDKALKGAVMEIAPAELYLNLEDEGINKISIILNSMFGGVSI